MGGSPTLLLLLAAAIAIVLGMGMPTVGVYVLLAALVAPALTEVGIPAMAAHLFVLYFGMLSMTTPPVAVALHIDALSVEGCCGRYTQSRQSRHASRGSLDFKAWPHATFEAHFAA